MKYKVTAKNNETGNVLELRQYATLTEAQTAIEDMIDLDLEIGWYENYDYYINDELYS